MATEHFRTLDECADALEACGTEYTFFTAVADGNVLPEKLAEVERNARRIAQICTRVRTLLECQSKG